MKRSGRHIDRDTIIDWSLKDLMISLYWPAYRLIFWSHCLISWMIERIKDHWLLILDLISRFTDLIEYDLFLWYHHLMARPLLKILWKYCLLIILHLNDFILEYLIWCGGYLFIHMHHGLLLLTSSKPILGVSNSLIDLINTKLLLALVWIEGSQVRYGLINRS